MQLNLVPGTYGTAILAGALFVIYVPATTLVAWMIGRILERLTVERQKNDGAWRGELVTMLNRVGLMAASRGEAAQLRTNARLYGKVDDTWRRQNVWLATMMMFSDVYTFLSQKLLAYLPALPAFISGDMSFRAYAASSELTAELIGGLSFFINVMPAIAALKANAGRLTALAEAIERVRDRDRFYAETGRRNFERFEIVAGPALMIEDLALCHRGHGRRGVRHRAAADALPRRPHPPARPERLRQKLVPEGGRGPLAVWRRQGRRRRERPGVLRRAGAGPAPPG